MPEFITITPENLPDQHLCCAISDGKSMPGMETKRRWLADRLAEGHVFRKLDVRGKVFIEYAPLESAWTPVEGKGYLYIYCLWVSGKFKGQGHAGRLLQSCIDDAKAGKRAGVCAVASKKKRAFLSDGAFLKAHGFTVADTFGDGYELLALSLDGTLPKFATSVTKPKSKPGKAEWSIYYSDQCPFIPGVMKRLRTFCEESGISAEFIHVDSRKKAKSVPGPFTNWAICRQGKYITHQPMLPDQFKKML